MSTKPNYYRHFDGMCWPAPGGDLNDLASAAVHGTGPLTGSQRYVMTSVISAYAELIRLPARQRDKIIRELRKGPGIIRPASNPTPLPGVSP